MFSHTQNQIAEEEDDGGLRPMEITEDGFFSEVPENIAPFWTDNQQASQEVEKIITAAAQAVGVTDRQVIRNVLCELLIPDYPEKGQWQKYDVDETAFAPITMEELSFARLEQILAGSQVRAYANRVQPLLQKLQQEAPVVIGRQLFDVKNSSDPKYSQMWRSQHRFEPPVQLECNGYNRGPR